MKNKIKCLEPTYCSLLPPTMASRFEFFRCTARGNRFFTLIVDILFIYQFIAKN